MDRAAWERAQETLASIDQTLEELAGGNPLPASGERRLLGDPVATVLQDPPPPQRVSAAERRGRRDWDAERRWVEGLINRKVAGELVEGIGIALRTALDEERAAMRAEFEAELDRRIIGLRAECAALMTDMTGDLLRHLGDGSRELIAAVDRRMERLDRLFDSMARNELTMWPRGSYAPN